jgi:hypothetical protein
LACLHSWRFMQSKARKARSRWWWPAGPASQCPASQ